MKLSVTAGIFVVLALIVMTPLQGSDWALTGWVPGKHRGKINAIVQNGDTILSAGDDGFLETWSVRKNTAVERIQLSPYRIIAMAGRPGKNEVCLLETDGLGLYRITVWNYPERRNIFTEVLQDPIAHVSYSMGGKFIIAARSGRTGLLMLDSNSGKRLPVPQSLTGTVGTAVTGKSERNMLVYLTSGALSYWDLESGTETNYFEAPADLASPFFFSNSRYLAGIGSEGLVVVNAINGTPVAVDSFVPQGSLLSPAGDHLFCLIQSEGAVQLNRYTVDRVGALILNGQATLNTVADDTFTFMSEGVDANSAIALGTADGSLFMTGMNGLLRILAVRDQSRITEAAVSGSTIGFVAENGTIGFIPHDYRQLTAGRKIRLIANREAYTHITAFSGENRQDDRFVLWDDHQSPALPPCLQSPNSASEKITLNGINFRSPIHSADSYGGNILFMDSTGNLSVVSENKNPFSFFSVGLMDAIFLNRDQVLLGRSAVSGNTPFLLLNINTGETVPLPYPGEAGVMLRRGLSGKIYAVSISAPAEREESGPSARTAIVQANPDSGQISATLADLPGEYTQFSLTELAGGVNGRIAATIGGEGAAIYTTSGKQPLERSAGLPVQLLDGGQHLIVIDGDGSIAWHDSRSGKLLAVFRLQSNGWTLQTEKRTVSGGFDS